MVAVSVGEFPKFVFKAFDKQAYARAFVHSGTFRIGALARYKTIEDANRQDSTEGEAHFRFHDTVTRIHFFPGSEQTYTSEAPGTMEARSSLGNPIYMFCTSLPEVDKEYLQKRFGRFLVMIEDPMQLATDIQTAIESSGYSPIGVVRGAKVEYTKGQIVPRDLSPSEGARLSYTQKPESFSAEHEFRFVSILGGAVRSADLPEYIEIDIGNSISYAKLL